MQQICALNTQNTAKNAYNEKQQLQDYKVSKPTIVKSICAQVVKALLQLKLP